MVLCYMPLDGLNDRHRVDLTLIIRLGEVYWSARSRRQQALLVPVLKQLDMTYVDCEELQLVLDNRLNCVVSPTTRLPLQKLYRLIIQEVVVHVYLQATKPIPSITNTLNKTSCYGLCIQ